MTGWDKLFCFRFIKNEGFKEILKIDHRVSISLNSLGVNLLMLFNKHKQYFVPLYEKI